MTKEYSDSPPRKTAAMNNSSLDLISNVVSLIVLASSVLGFMFKGWISEWIKSRFSKAVGKELDSYKHELSKELESYKTWLIRDLEQHKANIDIQRSVALKMADSRLDVLRKLHVAFNELTVKALLCPCASLNDKAARMTAAFEAFDLLKSVHADAQIFLPLDLNKQLADTNIKLGTMMNTIAVVLDSNDPTILALFNESSLITLRLRELIYQPPPELIAFGNGGGQRQT